jgi:hypothetical protein
VITLLSGSENDDEAHPPRARVQPLAIPNLKKSLLANLLSEAITSFPLNTQIYMFLWFESRFIMYEEKEQQKNCQKPCRISLQF